MQLCTKIKDGQGYKYRRFQWPRAWRMAFTGKGKRVLPPGMNVWVQTLLLGLLALPVLALPNNLQVSGASLSGFNGYYADHDASGNLLTDSSGNTYYTLSPNPSNFASYLYCYSVTSGSNPGYHWGFGNNPNGGNNVQYASGVTSLTTDPATCSFSSPYNGGLTVADYTPATPAPTLNVSSLAVSPSSLAGSSSSAQNVTLTVTLSAAAPANGAAVTFSNTTAGGFAGSVGYTTTLNVPAGYTQASETAGIGASSAGGSVTFSAVMAPGGGGYSYGSTTAMATVTIGAPAASSPPSSSGSGALVISPSPGVGGAVSVGTVSITSAQSAAVIVTLTSTAPTVASVPASVTIPAGSTSATFPVTCGSLAVSGFTTVSATISGGSSTSVIYSVNPASGGASGLLPDGQSTFTDGTGFTTGFPASGFAPPTLPVVPTLPGVAMPVMPTFTLPGIPALGLPGDLKIGIPGIGSIGIPTGWLSKIVQYAAEAANISTGMTGAVLTAGMQYAAQGTSLAVYNAGAALHNDNVASAAAAHADAQTTVNANAQNTQAVQSTLNNNAAALETEESQNTLTLVSTTNTNFTNMLTSGPGGLLTQLFQYLFIPDQATMAKLTNELHNFMNWGPYAFIASTLALFQQAPGTVSGAPVLPFARSAPSLETGMRANLSRPHALYPRQSLPPVPTVNPGTDLAIPVMSVHVDNSVVLNADGSVSAGTPGQWYNTGQSVPFDFSSMTNAKFWPFFRLMEGAGVYLAFGFGIARKLMPKQVL